MATASWTFAASGGATFGSPFSARDTVARLTPATAATSRMVGRRPEGRPESPLLLGNVSLDDDISISLRGRRTARTVQQTASQRQVLTSVVRLPRLAASL